MIIPSPHFGLTAGLQSDVSNAHSTHFNPVPVNPEKSEQVFPFKFFPSQTSLPSSFGPPIPILFGV